MMYLSARNARAVCSERLFKFWICGVVACTCFVLCAVSPVGGAPQEKEKGPATRIRILLLTDAGKLLTVHYETKGRVVRNLLMSSPLTGGIGTLLIDAAETKHETSKESVLLQQTVGTFNRRPVIEAGIAAAFKATTPYFEAVIPPDPSLYTTGTTVDFNKAQADGYSYVLTVREEFAGLATVFGLATLSAGSALEYKVTDATTGKEVSKGKARAFSTHKQEFDPATSDRNAFVADYAAAAGYASAQIPGQLNKGGQLHAMAEAHGLGNVVPDMGAVLAKYEKLFDYDLAVPKGWYQTKVSKFQVSLEPKNSDKAKFGVSFTVDVLAEEFGQKVDDLNDYIGLFFDRLHEKGFGTDTAVPFDALTLNQPYTGFVIERPQGAGKDVILFRRLDGPFVAVYDVVFLADYDGFLKKYSADVQSLINESKITSHS